MKRAFQRALLITTVICAGCGSLGSSITALNASTWDDACKGAMREVIQSLPGPSPVDCGFLALSASDKDFLNIMDCAKSAVASGQTFRFGFQNADKFFGYCKGAVRAPDGQLWALEFYAPIDKIMSKSADLQYSFNAKRCTDIAVVHDRRGFFNLQDCTEATDTLMKSSHDDAGD